MTPDQYVESVLAKHEVPRGANSAAEQLGTTVSGPLRTWAGQQLSTLQYSGSYAKETGVRGTSDVDVFISLKPDTNLTLKEIYEKLVSFAGSQGWSPRQQNVSVGVTVNGTKGDLVPGRIQSGHQNYHSLYLRKRDSWTQTNVTLHVEKVRNSGRLREIRAVKIWRMLHELEFPSLYLELFTIHALSGRPRTTLSENVLHALRVIGSSLSSTRIVDPANTSNILSDDLAQSEKQKVAAQAEKSTHEKHWGSIIW
jgi:hypothetical protein